MSGTRSRAAAPPGHFLFGHIRELQDKPFAFLLDCVRDYGDFVPLRVGPRPLILLSHPSYVEYVLLSNPKNFVKSFQFRALRPLGGDGLFLSEGDFWLRQRRLMQPAFHKDQLQKYGDEMSALTRDLTVSWQDGDIRDIQKEMRNLTMAIVAKTVFGTTVDDSASTRAFTEALSHTFECLTSRVSSIWSLLPEPLLFPINLRLKRAIRVLDRFIYDLIDQRRAADSDDRDLLSILVHATDEDGGTMTDRQLRDEALSLFVAGHETTANLLAWAWYLLSQHPDVEAKLVAEVKEVAGRRDLTAADFPSLHYTEMVVSETLRLYPPVLGIGREALEDCEIGGQRVSHGTSLLLSMWTLHRDPRYFDEPDRFLPERWENDLLRQLPKFAYFPFGTGPRYCIGAGFAMLEAALVLATVARQFHFSLMPQQVITPVCVPIMRPKNGITMRISSRT